MRNLQWKNSKHENSLLKGFQITVAFVIVNRDRPFYGKAGENYDKLWAITVTRNRCATSFTVYQRNIQPLAIELC